MTRANTAFDYEVRIDRSADCHHWVGRRNAGGYGEFSFEGRRVLAHRFGWELWHGPIPHDMKICHTCDNPPCQNPNHWFLGTQLENIRDRDRKGRHAKVDGERNPHHKLTDEQVQQLRSMYAEGASMSELAERYGVHYSHVWRLVRRVARP